LLVTLYKETLSGAALPPAALALQNIRARDREVAALKAANESLEGALLPGIDALEGALQALAQQRARAIQDALLSSGEVEAARVFMVSPAAALAANDKVRTSLSLK
jgi:hypothetical protein